MKDNVDEIEMRICKECGIQKPITNFPIVRKLSSGRRVRKHVCRGCSNYGTGNNIKPEVKKQVLKEAMHTCYYCGEDAVTVDHVIPKSKGGSNKKNNLVAACVRCNSLRDNMEFKDFIQHVKKQNYFKK